MSLTQLIRNTSVLWAVCGWLLMSSASAWAQNNDQPGAQATEEDPLSMGQSQLAARFKKLEGVLLRSAEIEATTNPSRAKLMQQAAALAKEVQLSEALVRAARSLEQKQYSQAIEDQKASLDNLNKILELLQSENRTERLRNQRDQVRRTIEETERLLRLQSSLRGRTEGGSQTDKAASDQQKLAEKAAQIAKDLSPDSQDKDKSDGANKDGQDNKKDGQNKDGQGKEGKDKEGSDKQGQNKQGNEGKDKEAKDNEGKEKEGSNKDGQDKDKEKDGKGKEGQDSQSKPGDKQDGQGKDSQGKENQSKDGQSKDSQGKDSPKPEDNKQGQDGKQSSESKDSQNQPSGESQQSDDQQSDSEQKGAQQPPQPKNPADRATQKLKQAQKNMQDAQKKLEDAERKGAVEKQREAEQELKAAIEELEEILRQLREEEIERSLTALEERLRLMLQLQNKVLDETKRLAEIGVGGNDRQIEIRANSLAADENKIVNEAQRALLLLREEGTSAAFPESLTHIISDMQNVHERLTKADIGKLTIGIESDIVSSLEELLAAMSEIKKENKDRKQNQMQMPGQQQGQPGEQPLVNQLAEMRLIKTLQVRINKRTDTLSAALKDPNDPVGQVEAADIQSQLRELSERQSSIKQVTRDIVIGKNRQ